jgi:zinc protease
LFSRALMGHSPYGHLATPKTLSSLTREDLSRFYAENFGPRGAVLAVTGKFDEDQVASQLERLFAGWKNQAEVPARPDAQPLGPAIYFYPKDVSQVFIRWGVPGIKRHDPKDIPLQVANYILGGSGFTSRLMSQIRSNRGLAYFVDSFSIPYDIRGVFESVGGTRPDAVGEYLKLMFGVMEDFAKAGPTEKELDEAKRSMIEEFAYNFESSYKLAPYKASLDFHGYPADYLEKYRASVKAVTREQATVAAQAILSQKDWVLVVCGPASLEKELSAFGKVVKVTSLFEPLSQNP